MKKLLTITLIVLMLAVYLPVGALAGASAFQAPEGDDIIRFSDLGYSVAYLQSPFDSTRVRFSLPSNWALSAGARVVLNLNVIITGQPQAEQAGFGGTLEVRFNDNFVQNVVLDRSGVLPLDIELPAGAMIPTRPDGRHELEIIMHGELSCDFNFDTLVLVEENSYFSFPHTLTDTPVNLAKLPAPFFLHSYYQDQMAMLVIPNAPSEAELQAALNVSAAFGRMSGGALKLEMVQLADLPKWQDQYNLIFVGLPSSFAGALDNLPFGIPVKGSKLSLPKDVADSDGIVQGIVSPWNSANALLLVTGATPEALVKASQAISTGVLQTTGRLDLAVIAEVTPQIIGDAFARERQTFADLGFVTRTRSNIGPNDYEVAFTISPQQAISNQAMLRLVFSHSTLVDYNLSGLTVYINSEPIHSIKFSDETAQLSELEAVIPAASLLPGTNIMRIQVDLMLASSCDAVRLSSIWATIFDQSELILPPAQVVPDVSRVVDFEYYPRLFLDDPNAKPVGFIVPKDDPGSWAVALQIAGALGADSNSLISEFGAFFAGLDVQDLGDSYDLIAVGSPSNLPFLVDLNKDLPAPFDFETNLVNQAVLPVTYRVLSGSDVGYLELMSVPGAPERVLLGVFGNSTAGLIWAKEALLNSDMRSQLSGNFAVIADGQVDSVDTRFLVPVVQLVDVAPEEPVEGADQNFAVTPVPGVSAYSSPSWIIPAVVILSLIMLVSLGIVVTRRLR